MELGCDVWGQVPKLPLAVARVGGIHKAVLRSRMGFRRVRQNHQPPPMPFCSLTFHLLGC